MVRKLVLGITVAGILVFGGASAAFADTTPGTPGQPGQVCQNQSSSPGNAASAPGSAFNTTSGVAGTHYAGTQPQNSTNPKSVAQYDVACFQVSH
jgi:hypothetical protein